MRYLRWVLLGLVALILIVFAVANRNLITLTFWPLPIALGAPLYLVVLLTLLAGFLLGELVAWLNGRRWRREARRNARRIEELERELAALSKPKEAARELTRP
ncbi:MAG TPA: lipopolysaccharide assembly protein LapA domain-containing protein [Stellaceae bacterium]|nr:lipopolysaccharide assembly protein LapA domain-containing protein [Stellaceae bacterium]